MHDYTEADTRVAHSTRAHAALVAAQSDSKLPVALDTPITEAQRAALRRVAGHVPIVAVPPNIISARGEVTFGDVLGFVAGLADMLADAHGKAEVERARFDALHRDVQAMRRVLGGEA